ncbi:MAG: BamA/TamA family outer membrane protein, partial [Flavobacteriaceae bacterium]|nr:BamA/TamA family outer membrane protein [Flavobacteriaceae bacterium]
GVPQDMPHPSYKRLKKAINEALIGRKNIVLASGHEHNLQYFYEKNNHFIKSGSGSKSSALPKKTEALFSDESKGYAVLSYYKSGEVNLRYFTIEGDQEIEKYSEAIVKATPQFGPGELVYDIDQEPVSRNASDLYEKKSFHRFIFGNLYREDWQADVTFRKLNLSKELGGLKPIKIGGGMSSRSIRLESKNEKQYVLRSVEKGVSKVVPELFQNSVVQNIFQDQIAASQPYAALVVPPLADAVGVYHTNPEIVYLPEQPLLGDYNDEYGGQLYLFEERPSGNQEDVEDLGGSHKIISYTKMLENLRSSSKYHIHQKQVLKSRLLDFYLGDWDRHDDQWRWATFKERQHEGGDETHTSYEPIPRDRDQVMFKYEGFIPLIGKIISPELRKFPAFGPGIKNIKYLAYNARHFDRSYLNELGKEEWIEIAEEMTTQLTDDVIESSVSALPQPIQELRAEEYTSALKARKIKLKKWAIEHYNFLAQYVDVVGTNKNEFFKAERTPENKVYVQVFQKKKNGKLDDLMYERTFHDHETKEIRLYGLAGKDSFAVSGISKKGPLIRVIGGKGNDVLVDNSKLKNGKSLVVYDKLTDNGMEPGNDGKDKRSLSYRTNDYNRKEFYYNSSIGIPFVGFNPDDGLVFQYSHALSTYGYRKYPYKNKHKIGMRYAFNSDQLSLDYTGHFVDIAGNTDLGIEAFLHLPENVSNFFGLSNNKTFSVNEFDDFDFFRYERTDLKIKPSLIWSTEHDVSRIEVGPYFRFINLDENEDSFVRNFNESGLSEADFESDAYLGIEASYRLNKVDNIAFPTTGIDFKISPSYNININKSEEKFTRLHGSLTLYNYLWIPQPFVLASKIEGGVNWGNFNFYQAEYIGLNNGLRGFRSNRFGGKSSLLFTNDLRLKVGTLGGAFPLSIGLIGSYDFGRVWNDGELDTRWHQSYGGGFFISPFDVMPISFYFMKSTEDTSAFMFKLGFAI